MTSFAVFLLKRAKSKYLTLIASMKVFCRDNFHIQYFHCIHTDQMYAYWDVHSGVWGYTNTPIYMRSFQLELT